ncbi:MAG: pentose kinase [bacterium]|nr:pentose kinase [bacterium]
MKTILAYDLGTGGNKASLYTEEGECLDAVFVPYDTLYPQTGWHEQRPADWWTAVVESTRRLLASGKVNAESIECLAVSGHSLGCVPLDNSGALLRETTPIWSDKRPESQTAAFFDRIDPDDWYARTGNGFPAPHYTVFKAMWYRDCEPDLFEATDKIIGTKDYINYQLTGRIATDFSYASGCGAYNLEAWAYDEELVEATGLPRSLFPEIVPSTEILGTLTEDAARALGLPRNVKAACGGVDNSCMALGARNIAEGRVYASLGSSAWIAVCSGQPLLERRTKPYVFSHVIPGMFTSAMAIFSSGSSFRWVRDHICPDLIEVAKRSRDDVYDRMTEIAKQSPVGAKGLLFNPSMAGGSSLDASPHIRGALLGLDLGHTRCDIIRAAMEGIALNMRIVLDELRALCPVSKEMIAVGGSSRSTFWRRMFADALDIHIVRTNIGQEAGSLGAAAVAAVGAGLWPDFSPIDQVHRVQDTSEPNAENKAVYESLLPAFRQAAEAQARLGDTLHALGNTQDS